MKYEVLSGVDAFLPIFYAIMIIAYIIFPSNSSHDFHIWHSQGNQDQLDAAFWEDDLLVANYGARPEHSDTFF